jgi:hypothetical protein
VRNSSGIGRGLEMTKPAWMTRREQQEGASMNARQESADRQMGVRVERPREGQEVPLHDRDRAMTTSACMTRGEQPEGFRQAVGQEPAEDTSSRGRGRGRTLPAWMTRSQGPGPAHCASTSYDEHILGLTGFGEGNAHQERGRDDENEELW